MREALALLLLATLTACGTSAAHQPGADTSTSTDATSTADSQVHAPDASCSPACAQGQVCVDGRCFSPATQDAGTADVQCLAGRTVCAGGCFDLTTSDTNCGACGVSCATTPPHMHALGCSAGVCGFACDDGWRDCIHGESDGCELDLHGSDRTNCGGCTLTCATQFVCRMGACVTP